MAEEAALEGMPVLPGTVHVFGPCGRVQRRQLQSQARGMSGLDPGARAGLEEALNALVPEASNHSKIVARGAAVRWGGESLTPPEAGGLKTGQVS